MPKLSISTTGIIISSQGNFDAREDLLAVEEPLEIRLTFGDLIRKEMPLMVTMRTPGNDFDLVRGFLISESVISTNEDILRISYCKNVIEDELGNVVRVELQPSLVFDSKKLQRNFYTSSSCGVCGKSSIESVINHCQPILSKVKVGQEQIVKAPEKLREAQRVFNHTGGLHAAGLFADTGELLLMREDVGRHNAFDKLTGAMYERGMKVAGHFILVSGRTSFELVQKCVMVGVPILAGVGAPSSLAVKLAIEANLTLLGFVKSDSFNIYSRAERIVN